MSLDARHYRAINFLAQPDHGGLTLQQIAEECGVSLRTIHNWKNEPVFEKELKKTIIRHTQDRLPEVMNAMIDAALKDRNAAMVKLILQMNDMLPTSGDTVEDKLGSKVPSTDLKAMQERIKEYKNRGKIVEMSK